MEERSPRFNSSTLLLIGGIIMTLVVVVSVILFLLNGEKKINGDKKTVERTKTLACDSTTLSYPIFEYDNSIGKSIKINATFIEDYLDVISLVYKIYYNDLNSVDRSESVNHAAMNLSFYDVGLKAESMQARYAKLNDNVFQMTLYANDKDLNGRTLKYFMLDKLNNDELTSSKISDAYQGIGFNCILNEDN